MTQDAFQKKWDQLLKQQQDFSVFLKGVLKSFSFFVWGKLKKEDGGNFYCQELCWSFKKTSDFACSLEVATEISSKKYMVYHEKRILTKQKVKPVNTHSKCHENISWTLTDGCEIYIQNSLEHFDARTWIFILLEKKLLTFSLTYISFQIVRSILQVKTSLSHLLRSMSSTANGIWILRNHSKFRI